MSAIVSVFEAPCSEPFKEILSVKVTVKVAFVIVVAI
jgi:hypothetical protein